MALKDIPSLFHVDTEEDLRLAVVKYFEELGFEADELRTETRFTIQLGHNTLVIEGQEVRQRDQVTGRSDLLLTRHGKPLAIVETKAPGHALNEKDAVQAISYARLLLEMAPYAIVTNGRETQVYDTFAKTIAVLETPVEATWFKDGQQLPSVSEDLRYAAARTLIGVNASTLRLFCREQVTQALEDIKGSPNEAKSYIPDAYTPRQEVTEAFAMWLTTDIPCFAVVAESGMGKTNFMCAAAEKLLAEHYFVLFYPVANLIDYVQTAVCNDFAWEFRRERHLAHVVERFDEIAREHGKPFMLFLEGIDQFPGNRETLKAELRDLVARLRGRSIRLCLSCKSFDWGEFIIDDGRTYNRLAKAIYPLRETVTHPQAITLPRSASGRRLVIRVYRRGIGTGILQVSGDLLFKGFTSRHNAQ